MSRQSRHLWTLLHNRVVEWMYGNTKRRVCEGGTIWSSSFPPLLFHSIDFIYFFGRRASKRRHTVYTSRSGCSALLCLVYDRKNPIRRKWNNKSLLLLLSAPSSLFITKEEWCLLLLDNRFTKWTCSSANSLCKIPRTNPARLLK